MNSSQKSGNNVIFLVLKPIAQQQYIFKEKVVLGNVISSLTHSHSGYIRTSTYYLGTQFSYQQGIYVHYVCFYSLLVNFHTLILDYPKIMSQLPDSILKTLNHSTSLVKQVEYLHQRALSSFLKKIDYQVSNSKQEVSDKNILSGCKHLDC